MIENYELSVTDLPFDWSSVDHSAIASGWNKFWSECEITGFKRDKNGNYVRDEDGKLFQITSKDGTSVRKPAPGSGCRDCGP